MATTLAHQGHRATTTSDVFARLKGDPAYQAFWLLRIGFTVAPIVFGLDKFFDVLVTWPAYLAPEFNDLIPGTGQTAMYLVGVIEIVAGVAVALRPRYGAYLVAAWLGGIILNLLVLGQYYDIALRDFGLLLAALTLARLSAISPELAPARVGSSK
ncbi:MAG: DoxX family membrane protein [Dehalococcoidia bacterium]